METQEYRNSVQIIGITSPFTEEDLTKQFKTVIRLFHPDMFPDATPEEVKGFENMTDQIVKAYSFLKDFCMDTSVFRDPYENDVWDEIRRINKYKQGYVASVCESCNGEKVKTVETSHVCSACMERALKYARNRLNVNMRFHTDWLRLFIKPRYKFHCTECDENGNFKLKNGRVVVCRKCGGTKTGEFVCRSCSGKGIEVKTHEVSCFDCGGKGYKEKVLFNPVFEKLSTLI